MSAMFRKPSEIESDDDETSSNEQSHESTEDVFDAATTPLKVMSSSAMQTLEPKQLAAIHYLSLIEKECREKVTNRLNTFRKPGDYLNEDHPDVLIHGARTFNKAVSKLLTDQVKKIDLPLAEFAGEEWSLLRDNYRKDFGKILDGVINEVNLDYPARSKSPTALVAENRNHQNGPGFSMGWANNTTGGGDSTYFQQYRELNMVGKGGYGKVYRVLNLVDNQHYAIKKMNFTGEQMRRIHSEGRLQTLFEEARTLATLIHPNIVRYYGSWVEELRNECSTPRSAAQGLIENTNYTDASYYTTSNGSVSEVSEEAAKFTIRSVEDDLVVFESSTQEAHETEEIDNNSVAVVRRTSPQKAFVESTPLPTKDVINKGITLFIKMSLHPLTLATYISSEYITNPLHDVQHCFHTVPATKLCLGILDGVEYLHRQNIIHRDLKPANVLLSIDHKKPAHISGFVDISICSECDSSHSRKPIYIKPCVGDFGLVAKLDDSEIKAKGSLVGTKLYRPPSLPVSEPRICSKLDIYSLGVIAFELITKFDTESERRKVLGDLACGKYPEGFENHEMADGIQNMLKGDRDHRWTGEQVRVWLEKLISQKPQQ